MYAHPQQGQDQETVQRLRREAGVWLKALREDAGLSQRDLAKAVGLEYYTFISQIESGRGRVPPAQYAAFAKALKIRQREFVKTLLRYYDPLTHYLLFVAEDGNEGGDPAPTSAMDDMADRLAKLEAALAARTAT